MDELGPNMNRGTFESEQKEPAEVDTLPSQLQSPPNFSDSESGPSSFKSVSRSDEVGNLCNDGRFNGIEYLQNLNGQNQR